MENIIRITPGVMAVFCCIKKYTKLNIWRKNENKMRTRRPKEEMSDWQIYVCIAVVMLLALIAAAIR